MIKYNIAVNLPIKKQFKEVSKEEMKSLYKGIIFQRGDLLTRDNIHLFLTRKKFYTIRKMVRANYRVKVVANYK